MLIGRLVGKNKRWIIGATLRHPLRLIGAGIVIAWIISLLLGGSAAHWSPSP
jgi:hypothetical protein